MEESLDLSAQRSAITEWKSTNKSSLGSLWLQLLKFYCLTFNNVSHVICIRQKDILTRAEKKWSSKKLAIEGMTFSYLQCIYVWYELITNKRTVILENNNE